MWARGEAEVRGITTCYDLGGLGVRGWEGVDFWIWNERWDGTGDEQAGGFGRWMREETAGNSVPFMLGCKI